MKKFVSAVGGLIIIAFLAACGSQAPATPTTDPNQVLTAINQVVQTQLAQTQAALPTATPTPEPTATETLVPTQESAASATLALPNLSSTTSSGIVLPSTDSTAGPDDATIDSDITIPDNTVIEPNHQFTKTWRIKNTGTTTWNSNYRLVYLDGIAISDVPKVLLTPEVALSTTVAPGATVDISVVLETPGENGTYKYYFRMLNPDGHFFGDNLWVQFVVKGS
ncbi:MAG TPA: NBR1-Ig-like domain-containing protein [Longilinea sp.]|nr:NBR1-Ig-like domain-containing protein [Longilinea sp.]